MLLKLLDAAEELVTAWMAGSHGSVLPKLFDIEFGLFRMLR